MARARLSALALAFRFTSDLHFGVDVDWDAEEAAEALSWAEDLATEECNVKCVLSQHPKALARLGGMVELPLERVCDCDSDGPWGEIREQSTLARDLILSGVHPNALGLANVMGFWRATFVARVFECRHKRAFQHVDCE